MPPSTNVSSTESSFLEVTEQLFAEAKRIEQDEPELKTLLHRTILSPCGVESFELAVASTVCYRLLLHPCSQNNNQSNGATVADTNMVTTTTTPNRSSSMPARMPSNSSAPIFCPDSLRDSIVKAMKDETTLELGHSMREAVLEDVLSVIRRDPATESPLEVILFNKGFAALCCHRAAYRLWKTHNKKYTALFLQSQCSAVFGVDIHPLSQIGCGIMLDHATGVVVGETAVIHDGCSILHGVTLGGTGKDHGDRHPKVGKNVLIGAGSSILGNIRIGDGAKIGAGSVVLRAIPAGATAVGAPAKIIGRASESKPGSDIDETLEHVSLLHKSETVANMSELLKHRPSSAETAPTVATTERVVVVVVRKKIATVEVSPATTCVPGVNMSEWPS
jgi:serine O-acetyltransferase